MIHKKLDKRTKEDLKNYFDERDYMVVAVSKKEPVRVYCVRGRGTVETARVIHSLSPSATAVLGKVMIGALLLTSLVKHATDQKVLLKVHGNGPAGLILSEADGKGRVRGIIENPAPDLNADDTKGLKKSDISRIVGNKGIITVIKELRMGTPYTSMVSLQTGEIAEDLAYYFSQSEQIPSAVSIGVSTDQDGKVIEAGGVLVQMLGGITKEALDMLEERLLCLPPFTSMMRENKRPEDIAENILKGYNPTLIRLKEVRYYCPCNEEIAITSLSVLSSEELESLTREEPAEVVCRFCRRVYRFSGKDIIVNKDKR